MADSKSKEQVALTTELKFFEKNKKEYLQKFKNSFVLIKGEEFGGVYTIEEEAYKSGLEKYGNTPFLIKQVLEKEKNVSFSSLFFSLKNARI